MKALVKPCLKVWQSKEGVNIIPPMERLFGKIIEVCEVHPWPGVDFADGDFWWSKDWLYFGDEKELLELEKKVGKQCTHS